MTATAWDRFVETRERYRGEIERLQKAMPELRVIQQKLVDARTPSYQVSTFTSAA